MTPETLLMSAVSAVTGVLCFLAKILWQRSEDCERDRRELREEIEAVKSESGELRGREFAFKNCPKAPCPFRQPDGTRAFSVSKALLVFAVLGMSGCATRIEGRVVNVTVSPATSLRVQGLPMPSL